MTQKQITEVNFFPSANEPLHSLLSLLMEHMFLFVYDQPPYKVFAITCHHQRNANRVALSKFTASMTFDLSREHETKRPPNIRRPSPLPNIKSAPPSTRHSGDKHSVRQPHSRTRIFPSIHFYDIHGPAQEPEAERTGR